MATDLSMSWLDKVGKAAMDAIDTAVKVSGDVKQRVDPLIDKSPLASKVRDRILPADLDTSAVPNPESNASPFAPPPTEPEDDTPLGDPDQPAQVYGPGTDPWTGRVLQLLHDRSIEHQFVDLESEDTPPRLEGRLVRETEQQKPPYVYLRGAFIGGFNAIDELARLGLLEDRCAKPEDRDQNPNRVRIVVPGRTENETAPGERTPDDRK